MNKNTKAITKILIITIMTMITLLILPEKVKGYTFNDYGKSWEASGDLAELCYKLHDVKDFNAEVFSKFTAGKKLNNDMDSKHIMRSLGKRGSIFQ